MIFTFGAIAWLMAVIEAMVAAPIVALGVTHPEGHEAFGKGEQAVMILMNVFLRPSMMIIGYIAAIALSYVSVWIINAGFDNAIAFVQGGSQFGTGPSGTSAGSASFWGHMGGGNPLASSGVPSSGSGTVAGGYTGWAGLFAYFFSIIVYTMLYLTVVQKSFTMIVTLPDKVLRWIGGTPESYGSDVAQWGQETQSKVAEAGKEAGAAQQQVGKALSSKAAGMGESAAKKAGGGASAKGTGGIK
jgi:defect-in-organelle-trafficking protein DotA